MTSSEDSETKKTNQMSIHSYTLTKDGRTLNITRKQPENQMPTIYKYNLTNDGYEPRIPKGGKVLTVQRQKGDICIWVLVDPKQNFEQRYFVVYGTGFEINPQHQYIGTVQEGAYVWHVFEDLRQEEPPLSDVQQKREKRWEAGEQHHPLAYYLAKVLDTYLPEWNLKFGGDGDAGEDLCLALSVWIDEGGLHQLKQKLYKIEGVK